MMKEYIHENNLCLLLDEDGDSFESFQKSVDFIESKINPEVKEFKFGYWDESSGHFIKDKITVCLEYSNWTGTVIRVSEDYSELELQKVRQWALEIYNLIHDNKSN